jgi:hypothetical protein
MPYVGKVVLSKLQRLKGISVFSPYSAKVQNGASSPLLDTNGLQNEY